VLLSDSDDRVVLNAGPLIYLAKLDALDVLERYDQCAITSGVEQEVVRPPSAYRFPEIARVEGLIRVGSLEVVSMTADEQDRTDRLGDEVPGLGRGERETIAVAAARGWSAALFDRRARRIGEANGIVVVGVPGLLFEGSREPDLLERGIRGFATLVNMRLDDLELLLTRVPRP
jgi:predicted nucleic acid-binding protein